MNPLVVVISIFLCLELANVLLLYFAPTSKKGNGVGVFDAFEKSKENPEVHAFVKYLINWVAGTKLIFIALLLVILFIGNQTTVLYSAFVLILSIATYFWRLHPLIRAMDEKNQITPKGYSKTLGIMILCFMLFFVVAIVLYKVVMN